MDDEAPKGKGQNRGGGQRRAAPRMGAGPAGNGEKKRMGPGARAAAGAAAGAAIGVGAARGAKMAAKRAAGMAAGAGGGAGTGARARAGAKAGARALAGRGLGKGMAKLGGLRRRRMFDGGELRLVLLKLIADEPRHGYELIKSIEELAGGGYAPSPGVVYPTLTMLSETGHVASDDDAEGRRRFSITDAGRAELSDKDEQVGKLLTRLSTTGEKHKRVDAMPVRRAMTNLKVALQDRLSRGETKDELLLQVAALIDEAAQKIERLD